MLDGGRPARHALDGMEHDEAAAAGEDIRDGLALDLEDEPAAGLAADHGAVAQFLAFGFVFGVACGAAEDGAGGGADQGGFAGVSGIRSDGRSHAGAD